MPGSEILSGGGANLEDERILEEQKCVERELGAKILTQVGFENRQKEIVDSSFVKVRKAGEKLPGKNNQRRNYAYLNRLEKAVDKYGNTLEKRLWDASVEKLVVEPEDITDAYWKSQERILRGDGQGRELSAYEKKILTDDIQEKQRESLKEWANYLGDARAPYPMWFKVYAWDGMSKMGVFDKDKGEFKKRDEHTVAPYPHLNQAVLGKVYGAMDDFYHRNAEGEDEEERDKILDAMVQSGSFNKLYSKFLREQKFAPKTPERTEDVHGEWVEYLPGQEEALAAAAEGTPWCVASPAVGRNYLEEGEYGDDEDDDAWEYDESDEQWHDLRQEYWDDESQEWQKYERDDENKAKFILFHLKNPETGELADNACASIRLDLDGTVAEISGLDEGQALEDSLVPIVEEKVKTLPGGEEFLEAFASKRKLIALDNKMQAGETLTKEDLGFIFGDIQTLDTYNDEDPRISELRDYALKSLNSLKEAGMDLTMIMNKYMQPGDVVERYEELLAAGVDVQEIYDALNASGVDVLFDDLLASGITPQMLFDRMLPDGIDRHFDELLASGIAPQKLFGGMDGRGMDRHFDELLASGIPPQRLFDRMWADEISRHLDSLLDAGLDVNKIMDRLDKQGVAQNFGRLVEAGVGVGKLMRAIDQYSRVDAQGIAAMNGDMSGYLRYGPHAYSDARWLNDNFESLVQKGVDIGALIGRLKAGDVERCFDRLVEMDIDGNTLVRNLPKHMIAGNFDKLTEKGASAEELVKALDERGLNLRIDDLVRLGADWDILFPKMDERSTDKYFYELVKHGISPDELALQMSSRGADAHFDELLGMGVEPRSLAKTLGGRDLQRHFAELVGLGVDANDMFEKIDETERDQAWQFVDLNFDMLLASGVDPNLLFGELYRDGILKHIDKLVEVGVDVRRIANCLYSPFLPDIKGARDALLRVGLSWDDWDMLRKYGVIPIE